MPPALGHISVQGSTALLSADFKGSSAALEKRGMLSNKHRVRAREVTHHSTALMETLRGENIKIFT